MKNKKIFSIIVAVLLVNILLFAGIVRDHKVTTNEVKEEMHFVSGTNGVPAAELKTAAASAADEDDFITTAIGRKIDASKKSSRKDVRKDEKADDQKDNTADEKASEGQNDQQESRAEEGDENLVNESNPDNQADQQTATAEEKKPGVTEEPGTVPFDIAEPEQFESGEVEYADNQILIKFKKSFNGKVSTDLKNAGVGKLEPMFETESGNWYVAYLHKRSDVNSTMAAVREMNNVVVAEYNFKSEAASIDTDPLSEAVTANEMANQQWVLKSCGIQASWDYLESQGINPGGSNNVTVAVIDTGVDYNHKDLDGNIWTNNSEIPDNGIDDDDNGYVDDYFGVDMTARQGSGMDDHGHGTHVAGIIAAENNNVGVVGIAYNTKIMPVKAGDASGNFLQSNIADAVIYAYDNGADVINMSFGGNSSSVAVRDALGIAYSRCVLVAAAGNDGRPNEITDYYDKPLPNFPGDYTFVLGVMSSDRNDIESSFSNWDVQRYNNNEYEVYAPGNGVLSTLPGDRYASLSGTSMASPVVAAQAALLRSKFNDPDTYPTKFIYGQISGTAEDTISCCNPQKHTVSGHLHNIPGRVNFENSLKTMPKPELAVSEYTIFDTAGFTNDAEGISAGAAEVNNGDGIIDSGEIIALGLTLRNRWGMSKDSVVSIDVTNSFGVTNPYVTILNNNVNYGSVGTYSEKDAGKIVVNDQWIGWEEPFYLKIANNCPNDYTIPVKITIESRNGLDESDSASYIAEGGIELTIRNGVILPNKITEDMTLTADNYYIIPNSTIIMEGATVTAEPGTKIQFWTDDPNDSYADKAMAYLKVQGKFLCSGSEEAPIEIFPSGLMDQYRVEIYTSENGYIGMDYTHITNAHITIDRASNCVFDRTYPNAYMYYRELSGGTVKDDYLSPIIISIINASECVFYKLSPGAFPYYVKGSNYDICSFIDSAVVLDNSTVYSRCVFYGNNTYEDGTSGKTNSSYSAVKDQLLHPNFLNVVRDPDYDKYYALIQSSPGYRKNYIKDTGNRYDAIMNSFANNMQGSLASINDSKELDFITDSLSVSSNNNNYWCGIHKGKNESVLNYDESLVPDTISIEDGPLTKGALEEDGISFRNSDGSNNYYILELPGNGLATDIEFDEYILNLEKGQTHKLIASIKPVTLTNSELSFSSDDETIATIDASGNITAVSPGTTQIKAYSKDLAIYNYVTVNVSEAVSLEALQAEENEIQINIGDSKKIKPVFIPANSTKRSVAYSSSDENVATVSSKGVVKANSEGDATITITGDNGLTATVTVHSVVPVESLSFSMEVYETGINGTDDTVVTEPSILPENATNKNIIWESSNADVCSVINGHLVKNSVGIATLKATAQNTNVSDEITVLVTDTEVASSAVKKISNDNFGHIYAITEAGEVYVWGNGITVPQKMAYENVKDASLRRGDPGAVFILDKEGNLSKYSWSITSPVKDETFETMRHIESISDSNYSSGSVHVIDENGVAWDIASGTPKQIDIDNAIVKLLDLYMATAYLDEEGNLYATGGTNNKYPTPTLILSGVRDIYSLGRGDCFSCELFDNTVRFYRCSDFVNLATATIGHDGEKAVYNPSFSYYINDGDLLVKGQNTYGQLGVGSTSNVSAFTAVPGITNAGELITTGNAATFVITEDGQIYGAGKNQNGELGIGTKENSNTFNHIGLYTKDYSEENLLLVDWSAKDGTVTSDGTIHASFNTAVNAAGQYYTISMKDAEGTLIGISKETVFNKLIIKPKAELVEGQVYTLTIPVNSLCTPMSGTLSETLTLSFEYHKSGAEEPEVDEVHEAIVDEDKLAQRDTVTSQKLASAWEEYCGLNINQRFYSNVILNRINDDDVSGWLRVTASESDQYTTIPLGYNYWGTTNEELINEQILDFDDFQSLADLDEANYLTEAPSDTVPFVTEAYLIVNDGKVDTVGNEDVTFVVDFNRAMDTSIPLEVRFGSSYPYADYTIEGEYVSDTEWQGTVTLTTLIENGYQYFSISNGKAAGTSLKLYKDWGRFPFLIDTASAQSLLMQGTATTEGIELSWTQDDFDTLAGYNVYRATSEDGLYTRVNSTVIPADTKTLLDNTVEPGVKYYYNFTVVQTDMTESEPSGKVQVTSLDTMEPNIYHTPVTTAYKGSNLVISATIIDNVAVESATLYYRVAGTSEWKSRSMDKNNDKYSAVVNSSYITDAGLEYYIEAFDGNEYTYWMTADAPCFVTVQEAFSTSDLGDVDGNGMVELKDALMLLMHVNDRLNLTEDEFMRADLDGNGELSAKEALKIINYINGIISSLR